MMKKNIFYSVVALATVALTTACSDIDPDKRTTYVKPAEVGRAVLVEDFTGQRCINCPNGTEEINKIVETYGEENIIAVGIHSGPLGFNGSTRYPVGLATDEGNTYYKNWDSQSKLGQPWVVFNRDTEPNEDYSTWADDVTYEVQKKAALSLTVNNTYDASSRQLTTSIASFGTDGNTTGKLQVWLVEDGITAMQMMPNGKVNAEYVHNHVFRTSVNGTWGEDIKVQEGVNTLNTYTYTLPDNYNADNVSVVAFVYNDGGVQQVTKKSITEKETND